MGIGSLAKVKAKRIIGIDASTKSLAFAVFDNGKPVKCGEVEFKGNNIYERVYDARRKTEALVAAGILVGDYILMESPWTGKNPRTGLELAYVYGAIISELMGVNPEFHMVAPITWQTAIGNPNLKKAEKENLSNANPGASKSLLQVKGRELRKQRTLTVARNHFSIPSDSDNIGDAVGIALYAIQTLTRKNP